MEREKKGTIIKTKWQTQKEPRWRPCPPPPPPQKQRHESAPASSSSFSSSSELMLKIEMEIKSPAPALSNTKMSHTQDGRIRKRSGGPADGRNTLDPQQRKRQPRYNLQKDPNVVGYHRRHGKHRHLGHQYDREYKFEDFKSGKSVEEEDFPEWVTPDYWSKG